MNIVTQLLQVLLQVAMIRFLNVNITDFDPFVHENVIFLRCAYIFQPSKFENRNKCYNKSVFSGRK